MQKRIVYPEIDLSQDDEPYIPERGLLAGVLERSYRDLFCTNYLDFRDAFIWFQNTTESDYFITYPNCVDELQLNAGHTAHISKVMLKFKKYVDNPVLFDSEREPQDLNTKVRISQRHSLD